MFGILIFIQIIYIYIYMYMCVSLLKSIILVITQKYTKKFRFYVCLGPKMNKLGGKNSVYKAWLLFVE